MANLYTKTGDKGQTSLVGGSRVSKSSLRVECYGTIDEANSMLGLAYAQTDREYIRTTVHRIQGRLFALGAELASDEQGAAGLTGKISEEDVAFLEGVVDKCTETTGKQTHFVIPGVDPASAALHVARTIVRRAERHVVALAEHEPVREVLARYINRLSDAVYALARLQEDLTQEERLRAQVTALVRKQLSAPEGGLPPLAWHRSRGWPSGPWSGPDSSGFRWCSPRWTAAAIWSCSREWRARCWAAWTSRPERPIPPTPSRCRPMSWARRPGRTARSTALTLPLPEKSCCSAAASPMW